MKHTGKRKPDDQVAGGAPNGICGDFLDLSTYCSFLRIAMAERIRKIVEENPDELDGITLPLKKLCEIQPGRLKDENLPLDQRFLIVAEKVDCLSEGATVDAINKMSRQEQITLADKLVSVIQKAGLADASFANIRLGKEGDTTPSGNRRIYLIDAEPSNVMILDQGWFTNFFTLQSSIYQKKFLESKYPNLFEKYAESYPIKTLKAIEIQRKTYLMAVAAPLEIGLAKSIGYGVCIGIQIGSGVVIQKDPLLTAEEKQDKLLRLPWMVRAAMIQGQARMIAPAGAVPGW